MDSASVARLQAALNADAARSAKRTGEYDGLWPEHVPIVTAFLLVSSQWRVASIGSGVLSSAGGFSSSRLIFIGLDYAAVRIALDAEGIDVTRDLWRGIRTMEFAAIEVLNESEK